MKCKCGQESMYKEECRQCYEDRIRRQVIDEYDQDTKVRMRMVMHKERCKVRMYKNYEGPSSMYKGK